MVKPKLLYLGHRIPYPPHKGDKIRSFHFLRNLAEHYEIYLGAFIDDPDDWQYVDALKPYCREIRYVDLNPKSQKIKSLLGLLTGEALSLPYYRNRELQDWVDKTIREQSILQVLTFSSQMAQYVEKYSSLHLLAEFGDVDSVKWRQYADKKSWPASWIYRRESETLVNFERRIARLFKAVIFVTEEEAKLFKTLAPESEKKIRFVVSGVDTLFFDPELSFDSPFNSDEEAIVFTGAMDYWPNVDAVQWFAQKVFPIIKRQRPQSRFYIVGSKPAKVVQQLAEADSSVVVTGRVDDVRIYLAHARLAVAPLQIARGIQNKVLEAMALAKPIVATSMAMEGIAGESDLQIAIADTAEEFAAKTLTILEQPTNRAQVNRDYVQTKFSWRRCGEELQHLLEHGIE